MKLVSTNPVNAQVSFEIDCWSTDKLQQVVTDVCYAKHAWQELSLQVRIQSIRNVGNLLKQKRDSLAQLITAEMGKVITESYAEIDKCIFTCRYYADNAEAFLADEAISSDAARSYVCYQPLGTILGIMPWNFPIWQVFRFAVPALLSGNSVMLKHASSVPRSAQAAEQLFHDAGLPLNVFRSLLVDSSQLESLYSDSRISAIALTASETTGRHVAQLAGANLKKVVLELGGSDAFIVLPDADLESAARTAVVSRFFTSGQSCINAKRIIVVRSIAEQFMPRFIKAVKALTMGDPGNPDTKLGPMARDDLRQKLHTQVTRSIAAGAVPLLGCQLLPGPGYFYQASILDQIQKGMPAYDEELFGPVAAIIYADDEEHAIAIANDTRYGLGGTIWTSDIKRGERLARQIETGTVYINGLMKSDPRLPFGGVKNSGIGRELGRHGMLEFCNTKTIWLASS